MCVKDDIGVHPPEDDIGVHLSMNYFLLGCFIVCDRIYSYTILICYDYL